MKQYVLMSNEELGELEHFGVRGMKWGVRKAIMRAGQPMMRARNGYYKTRKKVRTGIKNSRPVKAIKSAEKKTKQTIRNNKAVKAVRKTKVYKKWRRLSPNLRRLIIKSVAKAGIAYGTRAYAYHKINKYARKQVDRMVNAKKVRDADVIYNQDGSVYRDRRR